eukprot:350923-Chlamydomonas_euryale.AAC.1
MSMQACCREALHKQQRLCAHFLPITAPLSPFTSPYFPITSPFCPSLGGAERLRNSHQQKVGGADAGAAAAADVVAAAAVDARPKY